MAARHTTRLPVLVVALVCTGVRGPELVREGGWRAWVVVPATIVLLGLIGVELRALWRRRRDGRWRAPVG
ncbi:PEP-CTERM protein-sorting domain-containing protein [Micromonospora echinaurantiaca]|uniref:PEP-CTERM protein-sorting domain-containing protein n=1 Tax=Micromonospora echinaurantiaca TaxID=47857 RepID=A0A1C5H7F3_9ACTN|nr:hypothetical protein [Micromonospora echinaurantiaca]SCG41371.1 PEP-CTERM protein-sorting domain-containing protein [Micromonospora echinaurantiaca]